tara:strand:+ start:225 stop:608 length:384 start_codon:yes stop_codon:yes gene_type:complete
MKRAGILFLIILLVSMSAFFFWEYSLKPKPPEMIYVNVKLDNGCELEDNVFAVEVYETGFVSTFKNGDAFLKVRSDHRLHLIANPAFPDVRYDGDLEPVSNSVTLKSYCDVSERMINIFKSMNETFN